jgi:hypothetical protein
VVKTGLENDVGLTTPVRYAGVVTEADCDFVERVRVGLTQAVSRLALPTPTWRTNCYGHTHRGLQNEPKEKCADQLRHKFFPRAHQKLHHHHYPLSIMSTGPTKMTLVHRRP